MQTQEKNKKKKHVEQKPTQKTRKSEPKNRKFYPEVCFRIGFFGCTDIVRDSNFPPPAIRGLKGCGISEKPGARHLMAFCSAFTPNFTCAAAFVR